MVHPPTCHKPFSCSKFNKAFTVPPENVAKQNAPINVAKHIHRIHYIITSGSYQSFRGEPLRLCPSAIKCPRMCCTDYKLVHDSATQWHQNAANKKLVSMHSVPLGIKTIQFGYRLQFAIIFIKKQILFVLA